MVVGDPAAAVDALLVRLPVAVVVQAIAGLDRVGADPLVPVVAVPVAQGGTIAIAVRLLVRGGVAVVVQPVAALDRARVDRGIAVVAVRLGAVDATLLEAVPVVVPLVVGDQAVAVVVQPVAGLGRLRVDRGIAVVTIAIAGAVAIAVGVVVLEVGVVVVTLRAAEEAVLVAVQLLGRELAVSVAVEPVADLVRPGEDGRRSIVAVPRLAATDAGLLLAESVPVPVVVGVVDALVGAVGDRGAACPPSRGWPRPPASADPSR